MKTFFKQAGFTLIELMIVVVIISIVLMVGFNIITGGSSGVISYGVGGMVETRCVAGYETNVSSHSSHQVLDANGHGIPCKN